MSVMRHIGLPAAGGGGAWALVLDANPPPAVLAQALQQTLPQIWDRWNLQETARPGASHIASQCQGRRTEPHHRPPVTSAMIGRGGLARADLGAQGGCACRRRP
eukprot:SAG11_NODE_3124_length_2669_cov_1.558366_3_plen_104_part_00